MSRESKAAWHLRNRERNLERMRARYRENRDEQLAQQAAAHAADPERRRSAARTAYAADPETFRARSRANYQAMSDEEKAAFHARDYELRQQPERKQQRLGYERSVRTEVIDGYGGACRCCGTTYRPHLTIDHVHGDGAETRRKADQRTQVYGLRRDLRAGMCHLAFQVLCMNCNVAKHWIGRCGCQDAREGDGHQPPPPAPARAISTASSAA